MIEKLASQAIKRLKRGNILTSILTFTKHKSLDFFGFFFLDRVDTTNRLEALRTRLKELDLDAFLVPSGDSHQSEYVGLADKRRQWIGGFTGSSGFAVITRDKAAMWTDGR